MKNNELAIGLDLGGTNIRGAIVDAQGKIHHRRQISTLISDNPEQLIIQIADFVKKLSTYEKNNLMGIGIGSPGFLDYKSGIIHNSPNIPGFQEIPLRQKLQEKLDLEVRLDNDANCAAVGEFWCGSTAGKGAGVKCQNLMAITLGTGIGGGLILGGKLWRGLTGMAGEIGHNSIQLDGKPCPCGSRGCLERYASATAIIERALEEQERYRESPIYKEKQISAENIYKFALNGDKLCLALFQEAGTYLGFAIANLIRLLDIECIVLTGGLSKAGDLLLDPIKLQLKNMLSEKELSKIKISITKLNDNAGIIGAAALFLMPSITK